MQYTCRCSLPRSVQAGAVQSQLGMGHDGQENSPVGDAPQCTAKIGRTESLAMGLTNVAVEGCVAQLRQKVELVVNRFPVV